jgi:putative ABC transport system permease protein
MFLRILKQSFARQRGRKTLALLAVISGMTVSTTVLGIRTNIGDDVNRELRSVGANIIVRPAADDLPVTINGVDLRPANRGAYLEEADLSGIEQIFFHNNVLAFTPVLFTPARVTSEHNAGEATIEGVYFDRAVPIPNSDRVFRTGVEHLESAWDVAGRWPLDGTSQVLVGRALANRMRIAAGESIELNANGRRAEGVRVTGILNAGGPEDGEIIAPLALAQTLAGEPGKMREVRVSALTKPEDSFARADPARLSADQLERWECSPYATSVARDIARHIPGAAATPYRPIEQSEGVVLNKLNLLTLLIALAALAASALAISSVMTEAVLEREDEIALMKAVGARNDSIGVLFLAEAATIGITGGLAGFVIGSALSSLLARQVLGHAVAWKPALLPFILILSAAVTLVGSWGALQRAVRLSPALILRGDA